MYAKRLARLAQQGLQPYFFDKIPLLCTEEPDYLIPDCYTVLHLSTQS